MKNYRNTFLTIARSSSESSKISNFKVTEDPNFHFMKTANGKLHHSVLNIIANIQYFSELTKQVIQTSLLVLLLASMSFALGIKIM